MLGDSKEGEGVLTLQVRSPRLLSSAIVHGEIVLPLAELPIVTASEVFGIPHLRFPLTRPWDFKCQYTYLFYGIHVHVPSHYTLIILYIDLQY